MSTEAGHVGPEDVEPEDVEPEDVEPEDVEPEDLESVELEDREGEDYERFDCTQAGAADIAAAVEAARRAVADGDCIVLPTDTVYGIGADAFSPEAVQNLLDAKGRGRDMPPPVLVGDASLIRALATDVPDQARDLVEAYWPGPLTIVCRIQPSLRMDLGDTDGTIALRVPDHPLAREILRTTGPLAVSSANLSGQPAALTCDEAVEQLGERVAVYLDGGPLGAGDHDAGGHGLPSTIVDFTRDDDGQVLRRGALDLEMLRRILPELRDLEEDASAHGSTAMTLPVEAPTEPVEAPAEAPTEAAPATGKPAPPVPASATEEPAQPDEPRIDPEPTG